MSPQSVFLLKQFGKQSDVKLMAIDALLGGMGSQSVLLKHEIAYCLGQLQEPYAAPSLEKILQDSTEHSIVRHEVCSICVFVSLFFSSVALVRRSPCCHRFSLESRVAFCLCQRFFYSR